MADTGNIVTMLAGLEDEDMRRILVAAFEYVLKDIRIGRAEDGEASKNFGGGIFTGTTHAVANTEFSITHSFGRKPYAFHLWVPLDKVNASSPRLTVARAADTQRMYFKSPDTSTVFYIYVEG